MAKLIVCLDGTHQVKNQPYPTNVARIFDAFGGVATGAADASFEAQLPHGLGIAKYLPGVGTQGNLILRVLGSAFGDGIAEPIVRGYTFLSRNFAAGDEIFIVGFSRGATAARALAGFVVSMGLLDPKKYDPNDKDDAYTRAIAAWYQYRRPKPDFAQQARLELISGIIGPLPALEEDAFIEPPNVQAVGVFDTVSSLGLPYVDSDGDAQFDFSICDTNLSPKVLHGFHALSSDESRDLFAPTYWSARDQVEQQIFPGSHSNVGGGYPERGLSDGALDWMLTQLAGVGLAFYRNMIRPPVEPNPLDIARDDGATFPFNRTPRHARAFPACASPHASLLARLSRPTETLPSPLLRTYEPIGTYADGSPLVPHPTFAQRPGAAAFKVAAQ